MHWQQGFFQQLWNSHRSRQLCQMQTCISFCQDVGQNRKFISTTQSSLALGRTSLEGLVGIKGRSLTFYEGKWNPTLGTLQQKLLSPLHGITIRMSHVLKSPSRMLLQITSSLGEESGGRQPCQLSNAGGIALPRRSWDTNLSINSFSKVSSAGSFKQFRTLPKAISILMTLKLNHGFLVKTVSEMLTWPKWTHWSHDKLLHTVEV